MTKQFLVGAFKASVWPLVALVALACAALLKDPPSVAEVAQVREEICRMANVMPSTPEVVELRKACEASAPLAELVQRFERCKASLEVNPSDAGAPDSGAK